MSNRTVVQAAVVFGSGSAWTHWYQVDDDLAALVAAMDDARASSASDNYNGFVATRSVGPEWRARHPHTRVVWGSYPGGERGDMVPEGSVPTSPRDARAALARGITRVSDIYRR